MRLIRPEPFGGRRGLHTVLPSPREMASTSPAQAQASSPSGATRIRENLSHFSGYCRKPGWRLGRDLRVARICSGPTQTPLILPIR